MLGNFPFNFWNPTKCWAIGSFLCKSTWADSFCHPSWAVGIKADMNFDTYHSRFNAIPSKIYSTELAQSVKVLECDKTYKCGSRARFPVATFFWKKRFFFWPSRQNPIFRRQNSIHFVVVPLFQQNRREKTLHFSYRVELRTKTPFWLLALKLNDVSI